MEISESRRIVENVALGTFKPSVKKCGLDWIASTRKLFLKKYIIEYINKNINNINKY